MLTRLVLGMVAFTILGMGCSSDQPSAPIINSADEGTSLNQLDNPDGSLDGGEIPTIDHHGHHQNGSRMFTVRIENVSTNMTLHLSNGETAPAPHSPGVWTITRLFNPLFRIARFDSGHGLEQQAEDGDPTMLASYAGGLPWVKSSGVFAIPVGDTMPGPATPGKAYEFTVEASPGDHLTFTSMFGQSNDLFYSTGPVGVPLFWGHHPRSGDVTHYFKLWDAGTEVNQEPGLGPDQAPRQSGPNTGESEHKRILRVHDQYTYPPTDEVIRVTITPVEEVS